MLSSIRIYSHHLIPVLQEKITDSLTDLQKRMLTIASVAFSCLAVYSLAAYCYRRFYQSTVKPISNQGQEDEDTATMAPFVQAIELMFEDRRLNWPSFFDKPLTDQQKQDRHKQLKAIIEKLDKKEIDEIISYRDGMSYRQTTLLLQAIQNITDPDRRFEIVDLLLKKGADPSKEVFYYVQLTPLKAAEETKDQKLIQLIQNAINVLV